MSNPTPKVQFGLKNIHLFKLTETLTTTGWSTSYGSGISLPGAVNLSLSRSDGDSETFYADDSVYYAVQGAANGFTGDLEIAMLPDEVKTTFMNYLLDEDEMMVEATKDMGVAFGMTYEVEQDTKDRRFVFYKCQFGREAIEAATTNTSKTPKTEKVPITILPLNQEFAVTVGGQTVNTQIVRAHSTPDTTTSVYTAWHNMPHLPDFTP